MSRVERTSRSDEIAAHRHVDGYYKDYRIKDLLEVEDTQLRRGNSHRLCSERFRTEFGKHFESLMRMVVESLCLE